MRRGFHRHLYFHWYCWIGILGIFGMSTGTHQELLSIDPIAVITSITIPEIKGGTSIL